jgi:DNA-binding transcriptional ArsR family regulator
MQKENNEVTGLQLDVLELRKAALVYRAVNHPLRQQMLRLLHQNGKMIVTDIYVKLRLEQSVASQHLAILRKAGFVQTARDGKKIFYSVNYSRLKVAHQKAADFSNTST